MYFPSLNSNLLLLLTSQFKLICGTHEKKDFSSISTPGIAFILSSVQPTK